MLTPEIKEKILQAQKNEITEYFIYKRLSWLIKGEDRKKILTKIAEEEMGHYEFFKKITQKEISPNKTKIFIFVAISKIFGLTFGLKLMEKGEDLAQDAYENIESLSGEIEKIIQDESIHESQLLDLIDEERLKYVSSVVLGLNDALVELTGALVGFSLALQNTRLVGMVGLITGIAASLSMAASEYLSTKQEETEKSPLKASIYTGLAYVGTVTFLILPYLIFKNIFLCLSWVVIGAWLVIFIFTYYISVAKDMNFKKKFLEMAGISLGVAIINFIIGLGIRKVFGINV